MYIWSMIQKELYACDKNTILKSILIEIPAYYFSTSMPLESILIKTVI